MPEEKPDLEKQHAVHVHFTLPWDQDKFDAFMDGAKLREIILIIDSYLSMFNPESNVNAGYLRNLIHESIKDFQIKCITLPKKSEEGNT